mgnify:CR=1 FL=1
MVSAGDFRNGVTFDDNGDVYQIIEFQHVKPGKGAAFVRTKIRNVITGAVVERTFNPTDKFPTAFIERKDMSYSYTDGDLYYFMDPETFELIPIEEKFLGDSFKFCKEEDVCRILSYKGKVFGNVWRVGNRRLQGNAFKTTDFYEPFRRSSNAGCKVLQSTCGKYNCYI